jgi:uncharacterized cupin superfamily protein
MPRVNIANPPFEYDESDPEGYRAGMYRFGPELGAAATGTSVYEIPPEQSICPYHYEMGEEEWLMVVQGRPTLRTPEGEDELQPWDVAYFEKGPAGAHKVTNNTDETVRVLMWSTVLYPSVSVYPDSDKVGIWTKNKDIDMLVERKSKVDYFTGETGT